MTAGPDDHALLANLGADELAHIYIVSQVELVQCEQRSRLDVEVLEPLGAKCARCWNYAEAVGSHPQHPQTCDRCFAVVSDGT